ncbi:head-tail connector protein [Porphyromonas somerae]|uniref:head-tail connector protein n=1 Tax=Porphyromonas somerae TaxID=322095 RepID=UPI001FCB4717|nr:head-tail connector protein [Porphyromonas somerae]BDE81779.1 hypothetical protein CE91St14_08070 [Porphyromonas somerae]
MEYLTITELGLGHLTWDEVSPWCSLDSLKRHLIVEHDVDDELIQEYAVASWNLVEVTIERSLKELFEQYDGIMPPTLIHAVRLLVGRYYAEREGESFTNRRDMSFSISALLMPYKGIPRVKPTVEDVPEPAPQPEPQPEPEYTEEEIAKYSAVAQFLGVRICDLTDAERKWLASTEYAYLQEDRTREDFEQQMSIYTDIIQYNFEEKADELIDTLKKRLEVVPLIDGVTMFMDYCFKEHSSLAKESYSHYIDVYTTFGATYEKHVDGFITRLRDALKENEKELAKLNLFVRGFVLPLKRYFEALCKYELKAYDAQGQPDDQSINETLGWSGWYYRGSIIHQLIFYQHYKWTGDN